MTTEDLVKGFCRGLENGSASAKRLIIKGDKLINYSTIIALRKDNKIYINSNKYSPTTSKHQNRLRRYAGSKGVEVKHQEIIKLTKEG